LAEKVTLKKFALVQIFCFLAAIFWFYFVMAPWRSLIHSDNAVPFSMTLEPWRMQDLYYWGAARMGLLYEIIWKLFTHPGAGLSPQIGSRLNTELFYFVHTALFFIGMGAWLLCFTRIRSAIIFVLLMTPLTEPWVDCFLLAGQPYGILFLLSGLFFLTLLHGPKNQIKRQLTLGFLISLLWIQHELSGFLSFMTYIFWEVDYREVFARRSWIALAKRYRPFLTIWTALMVVAYIFKTFSSRWSDGNHYDFVHRTEIIDNFSNLFKRGIEVEGTKLPGIFLVLIIAVIMQSLWKRITTHKSTLQEQGMFTVLAGCSLCVLVINFTHWHAINLRPARYYLNLVPVIIFIGLKFSESQLSRRARAIVLFFLLAMVIDIQRPEAWIWDHEARAADVRGDNEEARCNSEVPARAHSCRVARMERFDRKVELLERKGCYLYLDNYWESHSLTAVSDGKIRASSFDFIRNPELYYDIVRGPKFCAGEVVGATLHSDAFKAFDCKFLPEKIYVCERKKS